MVHNVNIWLTMAANLVDKFRAGPFLHRVFFCTPSPLGGPCSSLSPTSSVDRKKMTKDERIAVRVTSALKKELEKLAAADHRSLASYAELVLREHVSKKKRK